jgi:ribosomal protein L11 methyltransferase
MDWLELTFPELPGITRDQLVFHLSETGFGSFSEEGNDLLAFIPREKFLPDAVNRICRELKVSYRLREIPEKNWNAAWEESYEPVLVNGKCYIHAPFHRPGKGYDYDIVIEPKMSFGTAHHETTVLMIEAMMDLDFTGKRVLDMGCGTGVLAILAEKMGASGVLAVDSDEWAYRNTEENLEKNNSSNINVIHGGPEVVRGMFHIILANINRNVLMEMIPAFAACLYDGGILLMSGFFEEDLAGLKDRAMENGLRFRDARSENKWTVTEFIR